MSDDQGHGRICGPERPSSVPPLKEALCNETGLVAVIYAAAKPLRLRPSRMQQRIEEISIRELRQLRRTSGNDQNRQPQEVAFDA
jgi:hypothetical protein